MEGQLKNARRFVKKQVYMAYNLVIDYISELVAERFSSVSTAEAISRRPQI